TTVNAVAAAGAGAAVKRVEVGNDLFTVMLITCYSENTEGIRATVESLSATDYPDDRKLLFLIADGIITGHGETMSTPDMCLSLITFDESNPSAKDPEAMPYIAVAVGAKQFNCAKVYAGHYGKSTIDSFSAAIPLILLIIVLFSPAFLILITTRKWVYLMWMFVYLCALPIWNFVLPVYSFWHFDDFSWGETRKVEGETKDDHSKKDGVFDPSKVPLKRWEDYERKRVRTNKRRERKERQMREMGATHLTHGMMNGEEDESKRGLLVSPADDDDATSHISYQTDMSNNPAHYFDPSKEAPAKAGSGYYPTYRPQSMAPPRSNIPLQPTPTAPGPWGPQQQNYANTQPTSPSSPHQMSPQGQYVNTRPNPTNNQQGPYGF
ncbi:hypothetical protein CU098_000497, partial [Rhizopus stolonifer]